MKSKYKLLFDLSGKTAVITGGLGILGQHFCRGLAEFGANIAIVDLDETSSKELAEDLIVNYGINAVGIGCDVASPESVKEMVASVTNALGPIHILHNNAASKSTNLEAFFEKFESYSINEWRCVLRKQEATSGMYLLTGEPRPAIIFIFILWMMNGLSLRNTLILGDR